jgi:hypothetical protein
VRGIVKSHLATFDLRDIDWSPVLQASIGLSQADIARAADEAAKVAVLAETDGIRLPVLVAALSERKAALL